MVRVAFSNLVKKFRGVVALDHFTLEVQSGEFFTFLGPSGCGKTTALRIVAGFYSPDEGEVYFDDQPVSHLPPEKRDTAMVFQNYALFPHMRVFDNVAYGPRARKLSSAEIRDRVAEALAAVGMTGFEERFPSALSGGQQQRVALARAIAVKPKVLLLDEPLSNLDAKLRITTRNEIARLQKKLGITTIYVTHDQEEALSVSDRIAVMFKGKAAQVGTPHQIYEAPSNTITAEFVGSVNLILCRVLQKGEGRILLRSEGGGELSAVGHGVEVSSEVVAMIRPERVRIVEKGGGVNVFRGKLLRRTYSGEKIGCEFSCPDVAVSILRVTVQEQGVASLSEGDSVWLTLPPAAIRFVRE